MGFDFAPGCLAGALLVQELAETPHRVDVGYFIHGPYTPSSGTVGTVGAMMLDPSYTYRDGKLLTKRPGANVRSFNYAGQDKDAISVGGTEHFEIPELAKVADVDVHVGWLGKWSKAASAAGAVANNVLTVPGVSSAVNVVMRTALGGASNNGPAPHQRIRARSVVIAEGFDKEGLRLGRVQLDGPNPNDLTAELPAWSARMLAARREKDLGTMGPISAFGIDACLRGVTAIGFTGI